MGTLAILYCTSCKKDTQGGTDPGSKPGGTGPKVDSTESLAITSISASSGAYNSSVIIKGTGFSANPAADMVTFNGKPGIITTATTKELSATVPKGAGTGNIAVSVGGATAVGPVFTYDYTMTVSTLAGSDRGDVSVDGTGSNAVFHGMWGLASDSKGNIYAPDPSDNIIRKITPSGVVTTFAGSGKPGYADGIGRLATFNTPHDVAVDNADNVFVTDCYKGLIRKITPDGTVTTLATGFRLIEALNIDENNNLYLFDEHGVWKISPTGVVSMFISTPLPIPIGGMTRDHDGVFYVTWAQIIWKLTDPKVGLVPFAGEDIGYVDGQGFQARFYYPGGLVFDKAGDLIVADTDNWTIRRISHDGNVTTLLGRPRSGYPVIDGPANVATFYAPYGMTFDPSGNLYIQDQTHRLRKVTFE